MSQPEKPLASGNPNWVVLGEVPGQIEPSQLDVAVDYDPNSPNEISFVPQDLIRACRRAGVPLSSELTVRKQTLEERILVCNDRLTVFPDRGIFEVDGNPAQTSKKPFSVLCVLAETPGQPVPKITLANRVWNDPNTNPNTIERTVSIARVALSKNGLPKAIKTNRPMGYTLLGKNSHISK